MVAAAIRRFVNAECRYTTWGITVAPMIPTEQHAARSVQAGDQARAADGTDAPTSVRS